MVAGVLLVKCQTYDVAHIIEETMHAALQSTMLDHRHIMQEQAEVKTCDKEKSWALHMLPCSASVAAGDARVGLSVTVILLSCV